VNIKDVQEVVQQVCLAEADGMDSLQIYDITGESHSITVPAGIIAEELGVKMIIPEGEHSASKPATAAKWAAKARSVVECGMLQQYTPLKDGLIAVISHEQTARAVYAKNVVLDLPVVDGVRGRMVELFGPETQRMYEIVVEPGFVRGGHYHFVQNEEFYVSEGTVQFELQQGSPDFVPEGFAVHHMSSAKRCKLHVAPLYNHTLWNPSPVRPALVICSSTHKYIPNCSPDTYWPHSV